MISGKKTKFLFSYIFSFVEDFRFQEDFKLNNKADFFNDDPIENNFIKYEDFKKKPIFRDIKFFLVSLKDYMSSFPRTVIIKNNYKKHDLKKNRLNWVKVFSFFFMVLFFLIYIKNTSFNISKEEKDLIDCCEKQTEKIVAWNKIFTNEKEKIYENILKNNTNWFFFIEEDGLMVFDIFLKKIWRINEEDIHFYLISHRIQKNSILDEDAEIKNHELINIILVFANNFLAWFPQIKKEFSKTKLVNSKQFFEKYTEIIFEANNNKITINRKLKEKNILIKNNFLSFLGLVLNQVIKISFTDEKNDYVFSLKEDLSFCITHLDHKDKIFDLKKQEFSRKIIKEEIIVNILSYIANKTFFLFFKKDFIFISQGQCYEKIKYEDIEDVFSKMKNNTIQNLIKKLKKKKEINLLIDLLIEKQKQKISLNAKFEKTDLDYLLKIADLIDFCLLNEQDLDQILKQEDNKKKEQILDILLL